MAGRRELPEDVVIDILSLLPVKSLLRFRCVCKHWCALIKDPSFIALHLSRASLRKSDYLVVYRCHLVNELRRNYLSLPCAVDSLDQFQLSANFDLPLFDQGYFRLLLSSCNGILCVADGLDRIVLFNPATREFKALPIASVPQTNHLDLLYHTRALGFGFDPKTSDYKVVRIVEFYKMDLNYKSSYLTQIYNLSSNSWRRLETIVPAAFVCSMPCFDTLFNGAWHWYSSHGICSDDSSYFSHESILSFHISDEVFQKMPFPDICSDSDGCVRSLTVLNESLALILYKHFSWDWIGVGNQFDIWLMGEYGVKESWTFFCKIGPLLSIDFPLAFCKGSELLFETSEGQLVSCNLHDQNVKRFQVCGLPGSLEVAIYSESLVSIKS